MMASRPESARARGRSSLLFALCTAVLLALSACGSGGTEPSSRSTAATTVPEAPSSNSVPKAGGKGAGTPAPDPLPKRESVTISYSAPFEAWAEVFLAKAFGEWEKENLDVTIQTLPGPDGTLLLSQGELDVQVVGISANIFNAIARDAPVKFVASTLVSDAPLSGYWINKKYETNGEPDLEKLKGSTVLTGVGGGGFGNPGSFELYQWMQENDLPDDYFNIANVPSAADLAQAVIRGSASIGQGISPYWSDIEKSGCCSFMLPTTPSGSFLANTDFLQERPEVAEAFFRALMRTNRTYLQGNYHKRDEVVDAISEATGTPKDVVAAQPPLKFSPDLALITRDLLPKFEDQFQHFKILSYSGATPLNKLIDTSPVDAILSGR